MAILPWSNLIRATVFKEFRGNKIIRLFIWRRVALSGTLYSVVQRVPFNSDGSEAHVCDGLMFAGDQRECQNNRRAIRAWATARGSSNPRGWSISINNWKERRRWRFCLCNVSTRDRMLQGGRCNVPVLLEGWMLELDCVSKLENRDFICIIDCASKLENRDFICIIDCVSKLENRDFICIIDCASKLENRDFICIIDCASKLENRDFICIIDCVSKLENRDFICIIDCVLKLENTKGANLTPLVFSIFSGAR